MAFLYYPLFGFKKLWMFNFEYLVHAFDDNIELGIQDYIWQNNIV